MSTRGSGEWRNSTRISPNRSIAPTSAGAPRRTALGGKGIGGLGRQLHELGGHQAEESVTQVFDEPLGDRARVVADVDEGGHGRQRPPGVVLDERLDELVERQLLAERSAGVGDQLERRQRVARRAGALGDGRVEGLSGDVETSVVGHPPHVFGEDVGRQEVEAQVLRTAADRVGHLLRVGGGEHEHDVAGRFLERLQQRRLGRLGEHVDLVEDVHLVPAGSAEVGLLDEVAHRLDTVVAGGVEFVHVVADAALDVEARGALAARLAVDGPLAVEHLGEDPRRRRLARAARTGEQVGLAFASARHGIAQRPHDVVLTLQLGESARAIATVERRRGHTSSLRVGCQPGTRASAQRGMPRRRTAA